MCTIHTRMISVKQLVCSLIRVLKLLFVIFFFFIRDLIYICFISVIMFYSFKKIVYWYIIRNYLLRLYFFIIILFNWCYFICINIFFSKTLRFITWLKKKKKKIEVFHYIISWLFIYLFISYIHLMIGENDINYNWHNLKNFKMHKRVSYNHYEYLKVISKF